MFSLVLQKPKKWCDDDDEFEGSSAAATVAPRDKPARKPLKYLDSDSEDDF